MFIGASEQGCLVIALQDLPSLQDIGEENSIEVANVWLGIDVEYRSRYIVRSEPTCSVDRARCCGRSDILVLGRTICEMPSEGISIMVGDPAGLAWCLSKPLGQECNPSSRPDSTHRIDGKLVRDSDG